MPLLKYIPLQLTCCLILGILVGFYLNPYPKIALISLFFSLSALAFFFVHSKKSLGVFGFFIGTTFFVFFFIGTIIITFHNDTNKKNHYTNLLTEGQRDLALLKVTSVLKPSKYYYKYEAHVLTLNDQKTQGNILINLQKDGLKNDVNVDDKIFVNTTFIKIDQPKNPFQFNYQYYLEKRQIFRQVTISNNRLVLLESRNTTLKGKAQKFRSLVNKKLTENGFKNDELAIVNALLLGQRQEISKELLENYSKAGAIHILAVSGLHVGIIMLLISFFLKPLKMLKNGKILHTIILILLLWIFAFIAGLSASVIRAVSMFTALSIGLAIGRKTSVYKNLIISLFFLLLYNPYYLFEVGFQLSYVAVFSIVWIQPMLYKSWKPTWKIANYFWQLFTVSLAAQLGVLPLSLYYFHQFPGLFFATNLVIIPVLGTILGLGFLVIFLSIVDAIPSVLAHFYQQIISAMNAIISWIAKQESFLFQEISFSLLLVFFSYLFIVFFFRWVQLKTIFNFKHVLAAFILLQCSFIYEKFILTSSDEFVIFNKSRSTLLAEKKQNKLIMYTSLHTDSNNAIIKAYKTRTRFNSFSLLDSLKNVYQFADKKLIVVDSLGVYKLNSLKPNYVLLSQSPKINLDRLIRELKPELIIADASNYKSFVKQWQQTCFVHGILFHDTANDGAYLEIF